MESNITTMKSEKFGTVRRICEKNKVLYCASDIAKSLGYSNAHDAVVRHCRASVKRATPISGKIQDINFIPEADVYRLICHSKLPSALEFEKWVFEDVVPKAVNEKLTPEPEQLTLETSEYHYFHKTFKGEPVITVADFAYFSGINADSARCFVKRYCKLGKEYYLLEREALAAFKLENPEMGRMCSALIVLTKSSVDKLVKYYNCVTEIPMIEEKKALPATKSKAKRAANEILDERKITRDDCIIALDVLRRIESNCENNVKMAAREGRSAQFYGQELSEVKNVIKGVGMLLVMGY